MSLPRRLLALAGFFPLLTAAAHGGDAPPLDGLIHRPSSELRDVLNRWDEDASALNRRYSVAYSPARLQRLESFHRGWRERLASLDYGGLSLPAKIDYLLLDGQLRYELALLDRERRRFEPMADFLPFAGPIAELVEARRQIEPVDPRQSAATLDKIAAQVEAARDDLKGRLEKDDDTSDCPCCSPPKPAVGFRAAEAAGSLRRDLDRWHGFYSGYDPLFTWWAEAPYKKADSALKDYQKFLRERVVGLKGEDDDTIVGDPIGADELAVDLRAERIPYTPAELIRLAERELAWCEAEMKEAAHEMGLGDDWKAALERVKDDHVEPGKQPQLVRDLAREAAEYVETNDLVTVPPLAMEVWRMEMMSPERQKVNPYFLGGESIIVSFPTDAMDHDVKRMSLRANNVHFARATVFHEVVPGHHLQQFMTARYNTHRRPFGTPFWTEGWALYWELLLYDRGFPKTPEDRIGMLFWRMHRCARIIFSLKFHLGEMTPREAIDFLVDRVGHERFSAEGEVRRSFNGSYSPLYQAAYLLGGLQLRSLRRELVDSGRMADRAFHDRILQAGGLPIELVRALLSEEPPARDAEPSWRFAGDLGAEE